jgi:hypothetical protein
MNPVPGVSVAEKAYPLTVTSEPAGDVLASGIVKAAAETEKTKLRKITA